MILLTGPAGAWIGATQLGDFKCPSGPEESRDPGSVCGRILAACMVHFLRNILDVMPKKDSEEQR